MYKCFCRSQFCIVVNFFLFPPPYLYLNQNTFPLFGLIYIYLIGQQCNPHIKAFDLRLEAIQHMYYITIQYISTNTITRKLHH